MNMMNERKRDRGQSGFTLIELLVVIAILAVLGGVAVFAVGNLTDNADDSACQVEKNTMITANQAAIAEGGQPPAVVLDFLDASSVIDNAGTLEGKYWSISNTAGSANAPVGFGSNADGDCDS